MSCLRGQQLPWTGTGLSASIVFERDWWAGDDLHSTSVCLLTRLAHDLE